MINSKRAAISQVIAASVVIAIIILSTLGGYSIASINQSTRRTLTVTAAITSPVAASAFQSGDIVTITYVQVYSTFTMPANTYVQLSGSNHSVFYVTEKVVVMPEVVNDICIQVQINKTIQTTYLLPSGSINGSSPVVFVTTSTVFENHFTTTLYQNVTSIGNGITCTEINPHYNVTQATTFNQNCVCV